MQGLGDDNFIFACIILDPFVKEKEHEISELSGETNRDSDSATLPVNLLSSSPLGSRSTIKEHLPSFLGNYLHHLLVCEAGGKRRIVRDTLAARKLLSLLVAFYETYSISYSWIMIIYVSAYVYLLDGRDSFLRFYERLAEVMRCVFLSFSIFLD